MSFSAVLVRIVGSGLGSKGLLSLLGGGFVIALLVGAKLLRADYREGEGPLSYTCSIPLSAVSGRWSEPFSIVAEKHDKLRPFLGRTMLITQSELQSFDTLLRVVVDAYNRKLEADAVARDCPEEYAPSALFLVREALAEFNRTGNALEDFLRNLPGHCWA